MTLHQRLKALRVELGLTQAQIGALGFVSAPGWIKIEHGQRDPSEKLLGQFVEFLVVGGRMAAKKRAPLLDELLTLKHLPTRHAFLGQLVRAHAASTPWGQQLLRAHAAAVKAGRAKGRRGRPAGKGGGQ